MRPAWGHSSCIPQVATLKSSPGVLTLPLTLFHFMMPSLTRRNAHCTGGCDEPGEGRHELQQAEARTWENGTPHWQVCLSSLQNFSNFILKCSHFKCRTGWILPQTEYTHKLEPCQKAKHYLLPEAFLIFSPGHYPAQEWHRRDASPRRAVSLLSYFVSMEYGLFLVGLLSFNVSSIAWSLLIDVCAVIDILIAMVFHCLNRTQSYKW